MTVPKFGLEPIVPLLADKRGINPTCEIPYGLESGHIYKSLVDFIEFLTFMNAQLITRQIPRLETFLMPAAFSSLVGEFMNVRLPTYCVGMVKNRYHNGHPDLVPKGQFKNDAAQHSTVGIEVKGSRYRQRWQGHNPENVWLMVFVFDSNSANDEAAAIKIGKLPVARPFQFVEVLGAQLQEDDWQFAGRSETSRRTITATIKRSGFDKMNANWIYRNLSFTPLHPVTARGTKRGLFAAFD